jgi:hypothetical protein
LSKCIFTVRHIYCSYRCTKKIKVTCRFHMKSPKGIQYDRNACSTAEVSSALSLWPLVRLSSRTDF